MKGVRKKRGKEDVEERFQEEEGDVFPGWISLL